MRKLILLLLLAVPLFAQPSRGVIRHSPEWSVALPAYEKRVQALSAAIKREAFIVAQVTLAMNHLQDDLQILSAMEKAHDRVNEALLRAGQDPPASMQTLTALTKMRDEIKRVRQQGTMADTAALRTFIAKEAQGIQRELFRELAEARGERTNLVDLLNRVQTLNADLEGATIEALGSTFEFMAAGGK